MKKSFVFLVILLLLSSLCFGRAIKEKKQSSKKYGGSTTAASVSKPTTNSSQRLYQTTASISYYFKVPGMKGSDYKDHEGDKVNAMKYRGCCFMAYMGVVQTHSGKILTAAQINTIREKSIANNWVTKDMIVKRDRQLLDLAFKEIGSSLRAQWVKTEVSLVNVEYVYHSSLIHVENGNYNEHWMEGDIYGNLVYDPYPSSVIEKYIDYVTIFIKGLK